MTLVSEILPIAGIELVGPLPAEFQHYVELATGVGPAGLEVTGGPDGEMATAGVEDPGEDRRAVVAREAEPVDRPVARDERGRVAVRDQPVIRDRDR